MRKLFKSLIPILLVFSLLFTTGVQSINIDGSVEKDGNTQYTEVTPLEEVKDEIEQELEKEESKEETEEETKEEPLSQVIKLEAALEETPVVEYSPVEENGNLGQYIGPDRIIAGTRISNVPRYESYVKNSSQMKSISAMSVGPTIGGSPTSPGQVTINKTAKPVAGLVNTWDITLRIEGKDDQKSSDIVLVIDRSGSMEGSKLTKAKSSAKDFVDALKGDANTRIALVSYSTNYDGATTYTKHTGLLDINNAGNRTTLVNAINGMVAKGGTNTQAGVKAAAEILAGSTADLKNIVLLSDGEPTQSYIINSVNNKLESFGQNATVDYNDSATYNRTVIKRTRSNLVLADFNYNQTIGNGYSSYTRIGNSGDNYYSHGNSAISQAAMYKNTGTLWTIALETTSYGNQVLNSMASPGRAYVATESQLQTIFTEIAGSISAAARDANVLDPMAVGFEIPFANYGYTKVSQGSYEYVDGKLKWNMGDLYKPISQGSLIKYAEMNYRVCITPDILDVTPDSNGLYPTNGNATIEYLNSSGERPIGSFPVPKVNPIFMKVEKKLLDANGYEISGDERKFSINIQNEEGYSNTSVLKVGEREVLSNLRVADGYHVSEILPENVRDDYDVNITVNGTVTTNFTVNPPSSTPLTDSGQGDILVKVTNKERPKGKLILEKVLKDPNGNVITGDPTEFTFKITGPVTPGVFSGEEIKTLIGGQKVIIDGLKYGEYTVTETSLTTDYIVTSEPTDGKVILNHNSKEDKVTITNTQKSSDIVVSKIVSGNMGDKNREFTFTATLTNNQGSAIDFPPPSLNSGYTVNGNTATLYLKHNESLTLNDIPIGSNISIMESDNSGYTVSVKKDGNIVTYPELSVTLPAEGTAIEFTNNKDTIIDSGVYLDRLPYIVILTIVVIGGIWFFIRKRKQNDFN